MSQRWWTSSFYAMVAIFIGFSVGAIIHLNQKGRLPLDFSAGESYDVDGSILTSPDEAEFLASRYRVGDQCVVRELSQNAKPRISTCTIVPYYSVAEVTISVLTAFVIALVGIGVYSFRARQVTTMVFFLSSITTAIAVFGVKTIYVTEPAWLGALFSLLFFLAYGFIPILFLHFTLVFPEESKHAKSRVLVWAYLLCLAVSVVHWYLYLRAGWDRSVLGFDGSLKISIIQNVLSFLFTGAGVLNIIWSFRRTQSTTDRRKIRLVIFGLCIGILPFISLWILPQIVGSAPLIPEPLFKLMLLFIPVSFAVSILRYKLMDVDILIHRGAVYTLAIIVVMITYTLFVALISLLLGERIVVNSPLYSALAAVCTALLFQPLKNRVQHLVDRYFFHIEYDFREALKKLVAEVNECLDLATLGECLVRRVDNLLLVERIGVFDIVPPSHYIHLLAHHGFSILAKHGPRFEKENLRSTLRLPVALPETIEPTVEFEVADKDVFNRWGMALVVPLLTRQEDTLGFLVLGPKKSGLRFTEEDIDLLTSIGQQAGIAMERLILQNKVFLEHAEAERLGELNKMKSYFVSSVSHDMKTPLTSIRMFAELLLDKSRPPEESNKFLRIIEGESERLTRLINNVLDFSRIERGIKEYHLKELELNAHLSGIIDSLRYPLTMENVNLVTRVSDEPLIIKGDPDALAETVINLISNAVKYSGETKDITVLSRHDGNCATVEIADHGIGIAREELEHIFEPYYRTANGREHGVGGVGLGLSIVKHVMDAHHGSIRVQSKKGEGTTISLSIPLMGKEDTD